MFELKQAAAIAKEKEMETAVRERVEKPWKDETAEDVAPKDSHEGCIKKAEYFE